MITAKVTFKFKRGKETKECHMTFSGETLDAVSHQMTDYVESEQDRGWQMTDNAITNLEVKRDTGKLASGIQESLGED